jgi:hypothetical protein
MSLTEGNGGNDMVMPVAPMYGGGGSGFGGWGGDNGWWIILLFLFALGGWGNGFGGGYGGGGAMPYIMSNTTNADVQRGFDQQAVMTGISGVQSGISGISTQLCNGFADVQQSLCNGFAGVNATVNSGFANAETSANARQMANMNQLFGAQTAMMQGFNTLGSQFADCCCENRLGTADLKYTIATENCADRAALNEGVRDILQNQNAGIQRILDTMCQDKIDAKNDTIAQLRSELMYARGQASQDVQTAAIQAGQRALANEVEQYVLPTPRPAYIVQNPNCCAQNFGCGCGVA